MSKLITDRVDELPDNYAVIDLDTGTVLGTNLVVVDLDHAVEEERKAGDMITQDQISMSDSLAHDVGTKYGRPLLVEQG